jgi:hypothetical protein
LSSFQTERHISENRSVNILLSKNWKVDFEVGVRVVAYILHIELLLSTVRSALLFVQTDRGVRASSGAG